MKDRLIITVSDVSSTKSFNVNKIIKKVIFWVVFVTISAVAIGSYIIKELSQSVTELTQKSVDLQIENEKYTQEISKKVKSINELGEQLEEIEEIIGINKDDKVSLIQRATLAKLTSSQKKYMLQTIPNGCPLKNGCITTSAFGWRTNPITHEKQYHKGIDLRAKRRTPVYATADGVVRYAQDKNKGTFGRVIIISHSFGFETVYGHLRFTNVKVGDVIKKGQLIAKSGNSGRSNGPHLHYEIRYASKLLKPDNFIKWDMKKYDNLFEKGEKSTMGIFSKSNKKPEQISGTTIIAHGTTIKGGIDTQGSVFIDGRFEGIIVSSDSITIGKTGEVLGEIRTKQLTVSGLIDGLFDVEQLSILANGRVIGKVQYEELVIEPAGTFEGEGKKKNSTLSSKYNTLEINEAHKIEK